MRRSGTAVLLVLAVVVAGCGAGTVDPDSPNGAAPTDASPTPDGPLTPPPGELAPGLTADGVENASALVAAHTTALYERGFELGIDRRTTDANGPSEITYRTTATPGFERFHRNATGLDRDARTVHRSWLDASMDRMLVRVDEGNETTYRIPPVGPIGNREARKYLLDRRVDRHWLVELLRAGDFEVSAVREDGEVHRYRLVDDDGASAEAFDLEEVHVTVDPDGVVHTLKAAGENRDGDAFSYGYRVVRLGVDDLDRPGWVATAPEIVDARPTVGFRDCTRPYLEVENPGPDAIPSGSRLEVEFDSSTYSVTLREPIRPGEARALYLSASGSPEVADPDAVPSNRSAMPNEAEFTVATAEGMVLSSGGMGFGCERASEGAERGGSATADG